MSDEPEAWGDYDYTPAPRTYEKCKTCGWDMTLTHHCRREYAVTNYWRPPERELVEAGLWERRPGYSFQFPANMSEQSHVEDTARALYEAYRGGLADWNRLTPENKRRWCRAAQAVVERT